MKPIQTLGKYELLDKIGAGGMAEVYKARLKGAEGFQKVVVVKRILPNYARNMSFIRMLVDEAKLTSVLQHPNIVQIFEFESDQNQFYMVMEFVEGKDLLKILAKCAEQKRRPPPELVSYIIAEACKGLHYAHNAKDINGRPLNIIHRDVSPSNIIISLDGHVKMMDFGVAKAQTQDASSGSRHVLRGKLGYMSPEQVRAEEIDHRSDIFSLGIVFFEALTLKRLFLGRTDLETLINIRDANVERKLLKHPYISDSLKDILRSALAQDRNERYDSAERLQGEIDDFLYRNNHRIRPSYLGDFMRSLFGDELLTNDMAEQSGELEQDLDIATAPAEKTFSARPLGNAPGPDQPTPPPMPDYSDHATPTVVTQEAEAELLEALPMDAGEPEDEAAPAPQELIPISMPPRAPEPSPRQEPAVVSVGKPELTPEPEQEKPFQRREETSPNIGEEFTEVRQLKGHNFRLQNTSGYIFGPVDYNELMNMVQIGAISEEELVSIDGTDWKRIKEISGVRDISPSRTIKSRGLSPIYSGSLSRSALPRIFHQLSSRRITGKLRFFEGSRQKEFFFRKGKIVHIASNLKQELVGSFLLRRGAVTQEQMDKAIDKARSFGGRIGDALVSLGILHPYQLFEFLDLQFREKFLQLFEWSTGSYEFFEGIPSPVEMAPQDASVYQFIMEGLRKYSEDRELFMYLQPYRNLNVVMMNNRYIKKDNLPLNTRELRILSKLEKGGILGTLEHDYEKELELLRLFRILIMVLHQTEFVEFK